MRIISGKYRGKQLLCGKDNAVRPTTDRIKENIFNLIMFREQRIVLDLFAGSGALGIECLSRGAEKVYFCESDNRAYEVLMQNLKNIQSDYKVVNNSCLYVLKNLPEKVDTVFLDPPYESDYYEIALEMLKDKLSQEFTIVVECKRERMLNYDKEFYSLVKERVYGNVKIIVLGNSKSV